MSNQQMAANDSQIIRVLYLDGVGPFGGASRSLYEAIRSLPPGSVEGYFLAANGSALEYYRKLAKDVVVTHGLTRFDNTQYSHYRGARWLVLLREAFHVPYTLASIIQAKRKWRNIDVIHVNEITEIIPGLIARLIFRAPMIVHVRSPQSNVVSSKRSKLIRSVLRSQANLVIAIDETVRSSLPQDINVEVLHNSFSPGSDLPDLLFKERLDKTLKKGYSRLDTLEACTHLRGFWTWWRQQRSFVTSEVMFSSPSLAA